MNHQDTKTPRAEDKESDRSTIFSKAKNLVFLVTWCLGVLLFLSPDAQAAKKKPQPPAPVEAPAPVEDAASMSESRRFVKSVQEMLAKAGYMNASEADGRLGAKTREAVKRFQKDSGLKDDGRLTPETFERLARKVRD